MPRKSKKTWESGPARGVGASSDRNRACERSACGLHLIAFQPKEGLETSKEHRNIKEKHTVRHRLLNIMDGFSSEALGFCASSLRVACASPRP